MEQKNPNSKLIHIEGKGQKIRDIVDNYLSKIGEGFDLTFSEIAKYLRCSYGYAQKHVAPHVEHIVISTLVRQALFEYEADHEYRYLFTKRKLFSRKDFERYLLDNTIIVKTRERYFLEDLAPKAYDILMKKANSDQKKAREIVIKIAEQHIKNMVVDSSFSPINQNEKLSETPKELVSLKDVLDRKTEFGFNYNIEIYRYIEKQGIPKLQIGSLIRYRLEDFQKKAILALPLEIPKYKLLNLIEEEICRLK